MLRIRPLLLAAFVTAFPALVPACARHQPPQVARPGATRPTAAPADPARFAPADRLIDDAVVRGDIPGAVLLVGRSSGDVYLKAYGDRALEPMREPMTPDTVFDLASLTKPIATATSVLILHERGKLSVHDKVAKHLPAFAAAGKADITIEQLLLHRGGLIADNALSDYAAGPAEALRRIYDARPRHPPGTRFVYSDVGYIVLGEIVRAVDGRSLDRFAADEIFRPLGMTDTTFLPPASVHGRCAPTEKRGDHWMRGEVHDPRAYALGGVAGHAGLFGTAADVSRYCRMLLNGGQLDGTRVLAESTVRAMTCPRYFPDGDKARACRAYGFDVDTAYSSPRGSRFTRGVSFGHTGFTGTSVWVDPANDGYVVLLASTRHPAGKGGNVVALRRSIGNAVADALLGPQPAPTGAGPSAAVARGSTTRPATAPRGDVLCGIDVLKRDGFAPLAGRRVALVTNHTGRDRAGNRTVDLLAGATNLKLVRLLSPEHGLYGKLDEKVGDTVDAATGIPVMSLYGDARKPTPAMLDGVDTVVFDVQDAGARYYTYISTMGLCMEAAADAGVRFVVLDRPNPVTGRIVDGPLADEKDLSFVAYAPIPVSHGMTVGELARLFNVERRIGCDLAVVPMEGWNRDLWWDDTALPWVNPSPNLRSPTAALLYLGLGLLEMSNVSVGRGTPTPFELLGAPWVDGPRLASALNDARLPGLRFEAITFTPDASKFAGQQCGGVRVRVTDKDAAEPVRMGLTVAWHLRRLYGDAFEVEKVNVLLKDAQTFPRLTSGARPAEFPEGWRAPLEEFLRVRERYLIYR